MPEPASADTIFCTAIEIADEQQRAVYLARACGDDQELRACVEKLVAAHFQAGSFLEQPARALPATGAFVTSPLPSPAPDAGAERPDTTLGPYKLVEEIGAGGMGTVFLAQQTEPVKRLVALKVIKPGMDSRQVIARFEQERQALALMDHPNIARVLDAGTTNSGRPYFVMELVKGVPITRYCDENRLTPRQRLELFLPVCQAVQHAHQKGVIHRDLKPSNILVASYDGQPVPKVIDFGIAKAAGQQLTDKTLVTGLGAVVGTLEYMSPEQAELNALDVDTRSDVYSLGVVLYELLTGTTPLDRKRLKEGALLEVLRVIREEEPPRPSTRLSTTDELPQIAANRRLEPRQLSGLIRGELDWIVMKALDKERSRRYATASGLAADLRRYLSDEPVEAGPPSAAYRIKKLLWRHRGAVLAGGIVLLTLVVGIVGTTTGLVRAQWALGEKETAQQNERRAHAGKLAEEQAKHEEQNRRIEILERWRRVAYSLQIKEAFNEYRANNVAWANQLLDQCEPDLRAWEWNYLKRLCHGEPTHVLLDRREGLHGMTASADGSRLAFLNPKTILVLDTTTRKKWTLRRDPGDRMLVLSPDGTRLARVGTIWKKGRRTTLCPSVRVWDTVAQAETAALEGESVTPQRNTHFMSVAFSPDNRWLAATSLMGQLIVWDTATGKKRFPDVLAHAVPRGSHWFTRTVFSPDGKLLATSTAQEGIIKIWDADTGKPVTTLGQGVGFAELRFSPGGRWLAAAGAFRDGLFPDRSVWVWDLRTGQTRGVFHGPTDAVRCLAFSPDETRLAAGSAEGSLSIWNLQRGEVVGIYRGLVGVGALVFSSDGRQVRTLEAGPSFRTWDATHGAEAQVLPRGALHTAISADGRWVAATWSDVDLWDTHTGQRIRTFKKRGESATMTAFSPDGALLAAALWNGNTGGVKIWSLKTGQVVRDLPDPARNPAPPCTVVTFSPDGKLLAAAGVDRQVRISRVDSGEELFLLGRHRCTVTGLAFSRDGKRLLSLSGGLVFTRAATAPNPLALENDDRSAIADLKMWEVATGKELRTIALPGKSDTEFGLSPDGEVAAINFADNSLRFYNLSTGQPVRAIQGREGMSVGLAFSPDGRRSLSLGQGKDTSLRLCDGTTGEELIVLGKHPGTVQNAAFSADGHKIVTCSQLDIRVWDARPLPKESQPISRLTRE